MTKKNKNNDDFGVEKTLLRGVINKLNKRASQREYIGDVGVDTGRIWIGDPEYGGRSFAHNEKGDPDTGFDLVRSSRPLITGGISLANNVAFRDECYDATNDNVGGVVSFGVACKTNYGDGSYPVYVTYDEGGQPSKLEIDFTP